MPMKKRMTETGWYLPTLLTLGVICVFLLSGRVSQPAGAQVDEPVISGSNIHVVPIQIERDYYGVAMVDTASQTLWIYGMSGRGPAYSRLKLLAARNWRYDRMLKQYNTDEPKPEQVKMLLENVEQPLKEPVIEKKPKEPIIEKPQQPADTNLLQTAEPNNKGL